MLDNHIVLLAIIPLMTSLLLPWLGSKMSAMAPCLAISAVILNLSFSICIFFDVSSYGNILYTVGGWPDQYGIQLKIGKLDAIFLILLNFMSLVAALYSIITQGREIINLSKSHFYVLFLLCVAGSNGIIISNDLFNIYVFIELASLVTYALLAKSRNIGSKVAAFNYLIIGTIAATFYLFSVGILYMLYGTLNLTDIIESINGTSVFLYCSMILMFLGFAVKSAMFPMHGWMINCYSQAPLNVVVFLSSISSKIYLYLMISILYVFIKATASFVISDVLCIFASISIVYIAVAACREQNFRKIVIYSSIVQISYIVMGIGIGSETAIISSFLFIVIHSLSKSCLFIATGSLSEGKVVQKRKYTDYIVLCAVLISSFSLIGVPVTAGFIPKLYLVYSIIDAGNYIYIVPVVISTLCSLIYVYHIVSAVFKKFVINSPGCGYLVLLCILSLLNILIGVYPDLIVPAISDGVKLLISGA